MFEGDDLGIEDRLGFLQLNADAQLRLGRLQAEVSRILPGIADEFYHYLATWPSLAPMIAGEGKVAHLKGTQQAHWEKLFSGRFDNEYVRHAIGVGSSHERIGLEPRWYIGAYCFILERLFAGILGKHGKGKVDDLTVLLRAAFLDMDLAISTYIRRGEMNKLKSDMLLLADMLDREVEGSVGLIAARADQMSENAQELSEIAEMMHGAASAVDGSVMQTRGNVTSVADASERVQASCQEISAQARHAAQLTDDAVSQADQASATVRGLAEATGKINEVVALVEAIASQTRLLALNATIEAARAGEAGKGFAVVASEVKILARQTEDAIRTISTQAEAIRRTTMETAATVDRVTSMISDIHAVAERVTAATGEQQTATAGISGRVEETSAITQTVTSQVQHLFGEAERTRGTAQRSERLAEQVSGNIHDLQRRLTTILRASGLGDRRGEPREPVVIPFRGRFGGQDIQGYTGDLTANGTFLVCEAELQAGIEGIIDLKGVGTLPARLCGRSGSGLHVQLTRVDAEPLARIEQLIAQNRSNDEAFVRQSRELARRISAALETAVDGGRISMPDLFSAHYAVVKETDPQQFLAPFTTLTDELLPVIQEEPLTNPRVVFCAAVDRNGYLPTHNRKYSQPQRAGERIWNTANCRNRRIFDDRTGLLAARTTQPCLVQSYPRDMGDGQVVVLKEFDSPVVVCGKPWGALRLAVAP